MVHHGFRSKGTRHARKQKYRLRQTTSHFSLLLARQVDAPRRLNQARIAMMNCHILSSDVRVKELQQLASDRSINVLAVQEYSRTSREVHKSLLPTGWQFLLSETPSTGVGGIGFLLSPHAVKALPLFSFPSYHIRKIVLDDNE